MSDILPRYTFLPWLRKGLTSGLTEPDDLGAGTASLIGRPSRTLTVRINEDSDHQVDHEVTLLGPGDVVGLQPDAIVKTEPVDNANNFESNFLAYIDFYEEDLPWRYTPAAPTSAERLRPWLALVVLAEGEYKLAPLGTGPLPMISLEEGVDPSAVLPDPTEIWVWAHAMITGDLNDSDPEGVSEAQSRLKSLLADNPDLGVSRILCPRELKPDTSYRGFLVPTFEVGRLSGLGEDPTGVNPLQSAWTHDEESPTDFPVYYHWRFQTGSDGDFEALAKALVPQSLDEKIGRMPLDIQEPGYGLSYAEGNGSIMLPGALKNPADTEDADTPWNWEGAEGFAKELIKRINLADELKSSRSPSSDLYNHNLFGYPSASAAEDDPIVTPPLFGNRKAGIRKLDKTEIGKTNPDWLHELNLEPALRGIAGLGVETVRQGQDDYMDRIWAQVGALQEANRRLRNAQAAKEVAGALFEKHIEPLSDDAFFGVTAGAMHLGKIGTKTVSQKLAESRMTEAAKSPGLRKQLRPGGKLMRKFAPAQARTARFNLVKEMARGGIRFKTTKTYSSKQRYITRSSMDRITKAVVEQPVSGTLFAVSIPGTFTPFSGSPNFSAFQAGVQPFGGYYASLNWRAPYSGSSLILSQARAGIEDAIGPRTALPTQMANLISKGGSLSAGTTDRIDELVLAPELEDPLYEVLAKNWPGFLLPNLHLISNNAISILETRPKFIDAFMAGANHEILSEMIWRGFPADAQGTVFSNFWDPTDTLDDDEGGEANLVLLIRGDLLRKYPQTLVYAREAQWKGGVSGSKPREFNPGYKSPIFSARVGADIMLVGFDLSLSDATGFVGGIEQDPGWFFVLQERPGEVHFGVEAGEMPMEDNSAYQASILYQNPVMIAIHAAQMVDESDLAKT